MPPDGELDGTGRAQPPPGPPAAKTPPARITGLRVSTFAAPGRHNIRSDAPSGPLSLEMFALGASETPAPDANAATPRWGV